jgi:hypothetical protein
MEANFAVMQFVDSPDFWQSFTPSSHDLERVEETLFERSVPQPITDLAEIVIHGRLQDEAAKRQDNDTTVSVYQPKQSYEVNQRVRFSALGNALATVVAVRPGENESLGAFNVIRVRLDRGGEREFAADYHGDHPLNADALPAGTTNALTYVGVVARALSQRLAQLPDYVAFGDVWFRRDLLPEVNVSHLIIAEAVIDVAGEAQSTPALLKEVELTGDDPATRAFALNVALAHDAERRFVNAGSPSAPCWALRQGGSA